MRLTSGHYVLKNGANAYSLPGQPVSHTAASMFLLCLPLASSINEIIGDLRWTPAPFRTPGPHHMMPGKSRMSYSFGSAT